MIKERLISIFNEIGFDEYRDIMSNDIIFAQYVFDQCAMNTCGSFGRNHGCPPSAGTVEERKAVILKYGKAFIISKILPISGEEMMNSMQTLVDMNNQLRKAFENDDILILGAGPCTTCPKCTALENKPCRFPDKIQYSMEGSGIDVMRMSMNQKMTYNAGRGKAGFFTLVLYN